MDDIRVKIAYRKVVDALYDPAPERVVFTLLRRCQEALRYRSALHPEVFDLRSGDGPFPQGHTWSERRERLEVAARACAYFNGRKNVVDTAPESGVLY